LFDWLFREKTQGPSGQEAEDSTYSESRHDRDLTKGSIIGNLWSLAWPMMIIDVISMLGPIIDMIWVGRLGSTSVAGVGVAGIMVGLIASGMMGLSMGLRAMVARSVGANDYEEANHIARQSLVLSASFSVIMAIVGIFFTKQLMSILGVEAGVISEGASYMRVQFIGMAAISFLLVAEGIMMASGDAVTPMRIVILTEIFHVILCPFFVFGWWIFPRMGVSGAALTSVFSLSLGTIISFWILFTGRTRIKLTMKNFRIDGGVIWRMIKIGIPASINGMQRSFVNVVMMYFIVPFGTLAVAAHTVGQRVEMVILMVSFGFGQAAGVLAGQNLGAKQPERAEKTGWLASGLVTGLMMISAIISLIWAENIVRIFNAEPGLVEIASTFLRIAAVGYLVLGVAAVLTDCLNGVGDTMVPMLASLITMWSTQVPMAYFLPKYTGIGVYGVRWAMVTALAMRAITYIIYFKLGRWKRKEV